MFGISWALAQKCRFWNYRDLNVFGISGSGLEMLILRLEAHFRHFPNHGSQILILDIDAFHVQFRYFLGPGLKTLNFCESEASMFIFRAATWMAEFDVLEAGHEDVQFQFQAPNFFLILLCPCSRMLLLKLSSFIFNISLAFAQQCRISSSEAHSRHFHLLGSNMWMGHFRNY